MNEGTYNNVYRNASPLTTNTPSSSAYTTNVNRTKTRKWVEAKRNNYDGDDWGNDYGEEEDDEVEESAPAPVAAGFRQAGQAGAGAGPLQPSTLQSSGNRAFSQPSPAFGHIRGQSFGRNPSGPASLQVQTQQSTATYEADPSEDLSDPSLRYTSDRDFHPQVSSPQSASGRPFASGGAYPGRREYSPVSQSRTGQAPVNASSTPARFPPRKSSLGQQDAPDTGDGTIIKPGTRTDSPGRPASGSAGTPTAQPHFIRPADIYRRMEEEKEKERRSMESGRQSLDSMPGAGTDRSSSPANAVRPIDQRRRPSFERDDGSDLSRSIRPTLAPVAERRSEYGLDRLLNESVPGAANTDPVGDEHEPASASNANTVPGYQLSPVEDRRKSVSPRLPDLTRMSGFGEDFFSGSANTNTDLSMSPYALPKQKQPAVTQPKVTGGITQSPVTTTNNGGQSELSPPTGMSNIKTHGLAGEQTTSTPGPAVSEDDHHGASEPSRNLPSATLVSQPTESQPAGLPKETSSLVQPKQTRPSLPGGWVTETTIIGSEQPTPMEQSEPSTAHFAAAQHATVSPVLEDEDNDIEPTTEVKHAQSIDTPSRSDGLEILQPKHDIGFSATKGKHDQAVASTVTAGGPVNHPTPQALPPLQTANHLLASTTPSTTVTSEFRSPSSADSPSKQSSSECQLANPAGSGFIPTAPLNPRRVDSQQTELVSPDYPARQMTLSSVETSSPNESDRLREDIIKSLSPVIAPGVGDLAASTSRATPLRQASGDESRDSRYLSDVYDDYIGPSEDKSLRETSQLLKESVNTADHPSRDPTPTPSFPSQPQDETRVVPTQTPPKNSGGTLPSLTRRFSWENGPEQVTLSPVEALQANEFGSRTDGDDVDDKQMKQSTVLSPHESALSPMVNIEAGNDGTMSHRVSLVSSHTPGGLGVAGIEPPSPVSIMSAEKSPAERRLSLADEKARIQTSSTPLSPSPPQDGHPAFSKPLPETTNQETESAVPDVPSKQLNIIAWREILNLPSPELRIKRFEEARTQYTSMDSGLSNWLEGMTSQPEHAALSSQRDVSDGPATGVPEQSGQGSPTGAQAAATQQPYYQQYLNASNPNIANPPPGPVRQSTGNLLSQSQQSSSGFNSGNQVGAKGKELLHAAGAFGNKATKAGVKSGMKLFNKGKNKLRGNGDKAFQ